MVYVKSNENWVGLANVTARVNMSGFIVENHTDIIVYEANKSIGNRRWRDVSPTLLPADNYTNATMCVAAYNLNDSALGNISLCFNTTLGTFNNGKNLYCTATDGLLPHGSIRRDVHTAEI